SDRLLLRQIGHQRQMPARNASQPVGSPLLRLTPARCDQHGQRSARGNHSAKGASMDHSEVESFGRQVVPLATSVSTRLWMAAPNLAKRNRGKGEGAGI